MKNPLWDIPVEKQHNLLERARELRRDMTPQERKLWYRFLRGYPVKMYKQRIIDHFIVDFYCSKARVVIEVDGSQHFTEEGMARDRERSLSFEKYGILVIRFSNAEVDRNFGWVCEEIHRTIAGRLGADSPTKPFDHLR